MTVSTFATGLRAMLTAGAVLCPAVAGAQAVDYQALQETIGEPVTTSVTGKPQRRRSSSRARISPGRPPATYPGC
jgi:outer membrane receptor for ferrienterochelin and colicins